MKITDTQKIATVQRIAETETSIAALEAMRVQWNKRNCKTEQALRIRPQVCAIIEQQLERRKEELFQSLGYRH